MSNLAGKNAIVTGGSRGLGRAIASALTGAGAVVTILGRSRSSLDDALAAGVASHARTVDIEDMAALEAEIRAIDGQRPTDILVNNAGTALLRSFGATDRAIFDTMLAQHLHAPVVASQIVLPGMIARGLGRIINIGSTAAIKGYVFLTAYTAAKHAMLGLTRSLALEVAKTGVTINCICPGFAATDLVQESFAARAAKQRRSTDDLMAEFAATKPMGRLVRPEEIAATALCLVGEGAASVTGQAIIVDGGESIA